MPLKFFLPFRRGMSWNILAAAMTGIAACLCAYFTLPTRAEHDAGAAAARRHFDEKIAPLLAARCLTCHSGDEPKGELDLSRRASALAGGESGEVFAPGDPDSSLLWQYVEAGEMPPKHPLSDEEQLLLREWIAEGAVWGTETIDLFQYTSEARAGYDWWSLQPIVTPVLPEVQNRSWARSPIDLFILARLEAAGLEPSPEADRRTLIRRAAFDLTGLPPTPEEIEAFINDERPNAYEILIDRLLASPHYGERWARHWLDVARFGESDGFEYDRLRPNAWPYRDWVIEMLNADLPFNEFARRQIAGDAMQPDDFSSVAATGFLVGGAFDGLIPAGNTMRQIMRQDELEDLVGTVGQAFLGITVHCARCHDHKFDPVRQKEYFQISAALAGVRRGEREVEGKKVYAVTPHAPPQSHLLRRGSPFDPIEPVAPGGIAAVAGASAAFELPENAADGARRKALAEWIASDDNPLFARTIANRVWRHHFGMGLVGTPNDLGFNGGLASHPELLDWLALELRRHGWRLKPLHRAIVLSSAYRQSSAARPSAMERDAENRLLWRKSPQRLEAETARDAMLAVSGQLNAAMGGPPFLDFKTYDHKGTQVYEPIDAEGPDVHRRSIYRMWARGGNNPLLDTFDCPDPSTSTPQRGVTTTPLQSLALLNNAFALRMADRFAERLAREAGDGLAAQIELAFNLCYGRNPSDEERELSQQFAEEHGMAALGRVMFNSNEFLYIE